mmetsp:Transcript_17655/g.43397  ORF Transcript_17655/g.43397 Transcript_17655/m.43397 type:complete len:261 (-) Transcript_17655:181-963(-)
MTVVTQRRPFPRQLTDARDCPRVGRPPVHSSRRPASHALRARRRCRRARWRCTRRRGGSRSRRSSGRNSRSHSSNRCSRGPPTLSRRCRCRRALRRCPRRRGRSSRGSRSSGSRRSGLPTFSRRRRCRLRCGNRAHSLASPRRALLQPLQGFVVTQRGTLAQYSRAKLLAHQPDTAVHVDLRPFEQKQYAVLHELPSHRWPLRAAVVAAGVVAVVNAGRTWCWRRTRQRRGLERRARPPPRARAVRRGGLDHLLMAVGDP